MQHSTCTVTARLLYSSGLLLSFGGVHMLSLREMKLYASPTKNQTRYTGFQQQACSWQSPLLLGEKQRSTLFFFFHIVTVKSETDYDKK